MVKLQNNQANTDGGAIYAASVIAFVKNASVIFYNNTAIRHGGSVYFTGAYVRIKSHLKFMGNSSVIFNANRAMGAGGALSLQHAFAPGDDIYLITYNKTLLNVISSLMFEDTSTVMFIDNEARYGGAIYSNLNTIFGGNSTATFNYNKAEYGGAICFEKDVLFKEDYMMVSTNVNTRKPKWQSN